MPIIMPILDFKMATVSVKWFMLSKTSPRNTCSCYVTDIEINVSFKIQSNDPGLELITKV